MVFRIIRFLNRSTTQLQIEFSEDLDENIGISNIQVVSELANVPDLVVRSSSIQARILTVNTNQQRPFALYRAKFISTTAQSFSSVSGNRLHEESSDAAASFVGLEDANQIRDDMIDNASPVYDLETDTFVRKHVQNLSRQFLKARTDVRETGNANYISIEVEDERRVRGFSPTDRLANEGAFIVTRVGKTQTGASLLRQIMFEAARGVTLLGSNAGLVNDQILSFPADPVSLRTESVVKEIVSNVETLQNKFESLTVTLSHSNISQIHSIVLRQAGGAVFNYDVPLYGYSLLNNRYDTVNAGRLLTLASNQFKISDTPVLGSVFPEPQGTDTLEISYSYIDNGINVSSSSVVVSEVKTSTRESIGGFLTTFFLANFPVVTATDGAPISGGVQFLDPAPSTGVPFVATHPAFTNEIAFSETRLPTQAGQYSVNYPAGQVFVFGESIADGTGSGPPVATYFYRKTYVSGIDYVFEPDADEIAAVSTRDLIGQEVKVSFSYEQVLSEGEDYLAHVHNEVINERVDNRLVSTFRVAASNTPITNVVQVFNETTGEIYSISRFDENYITFSGRNAPRVLTQANELASFERVFNEQLFVSETISDSGTVKVVKIQLQNNLITSNTGDQLGANFNTSVSLSSTAFSAELFYDGVLQTVTVNLAKLSLNGDYLIDYDNGVIYLQVASTVDTYGDINYSHGSIDTAFSNILAPETLNYRATNNSAVVLDVEMPSFTSELISTSGLRLGGERFLNNNSNKPLYYGSKGSGSAGQRSPGSTIFVALDAIFTADMVDGNHIIRFPDDADRTITAFRSMTEVEVDLAFTDNAKSLDWCVIDFDLTDGDGYNVAVTYDIQSVRAVYAVSELQTLPADSLTNFWDPELDTFSGNVITFNNSAVSALTPGDSLSVDYNLGNLYVDYQYVADNLIITYEYGDNSIDHSISDTLARGDEYFVSYRYGALREGLQTNFGALTQIQELQDFPFDFDRELYRDTTAGAIQAFLKGPTADAIRTAVSSVTNVDPDITELTFNEWTLDRDNLHLQEGIYTGTPTYDDGKFGFGLVVDNTDTFVFPSESYISLREGTFEGWVRPLWRGLDNDASLTFDIGQDGYTAVSGGGLQDGYVLSLSDIYIGAMGWNPTSSPFTINRSDADPESPLGRPATFGTLSGYYIWYDSDQNEWFLRAVSAPSDSINFVGRITTTGEMYNVRDGYNYTSSLDINDVTETIRSTSSYIEYNFSVDGYDSAGADGYVDTDGYLYQDGINWLSDDLHYVFDTGISASYNRMSLFKDGSGYLNFRVYDDTGQNIQGGSRFYNISNNISSWLAGGLHHVAASWRLNSSEGIDEMHLFVDGQEVANLYKYGGRPIAGTSDVFRTVADEVVIASAPKNILIAADGSSSSGSTSFISLSSSFITDGIVPGDVFAILDATADAMISRTVASVSTSTTLVLSAPFTLTLDNINFSVNQTSVLTETPLFAEKIAVFKTDIDGYRTELSGIAAESPEYSIERSGHDTTININGNVEVGDEVVINTLGLTRGRCRDVVYKYDISNQLKTNLEPPVDLADVDIFKVLCKRIPIQANALHNPGDGYGDGYWLADGYELDGTFTNLCQPSNAVRGKVLRVTLGGTSNIDFSGINEVTFNGTTFGGPITETLTFTNYGVKVTTEFWTSITSVGATFTGVDPSTFFGSFEIIEDVSLTREENSGDYAQVGFYENGQLSLYIFGSGGLKFLLDSCYYLLDYHTRLNISYSLKGDLYIGSSIEGTGQFDGALDDILFLNEMLSDVRTGEVPDSSVRTITEDFNSVRAAVVTPQTLMLLDLDENINNLNTFYKTYDEQFFTSSMGINSTFGDSGIFLNDPFIIDNGPVVLDNDQGTIEFWISPIVDIINDMNHTRYYVDIAAAALESAQSLTATTVQLGQRAKSIKSVRLVTDTDGSGTDFFEGGVLGRDGRTITLGQPLPAQRTNVSVQYVSVNSMGDRLSIYKDGYGSINFEILAEEQVYKISYPIAWSRNTWHRVMASWDLNNTDNQDRIRLFIDGVESGTILYGTPGLLYGIGVLYGSAAVGSLGSNFLTTDINFTDSLGELFIGNSFDRTSPAKARIDNLRFSSIVRTPSSVAGISVDLNYTANLPTALPVIEDSFTSALFDFDKEVEETEFLSNVLSETTPLFLFDVDIIDSFDRIAGNQRAQDLLESIIERLKPAHTDAFVRFLD